MLGGGRRLGVEPGEGEPRQLTGPGLHPAGGGVELGEQGAVLVVRIRAVDEREDGRVLQLPGPGVPDGPLVGRRRGEPRLRQVVPVGEVRQDEGGVDGGDHIGQVQCPAAVRGDDLGHRTRLDGVPQFDDGEPGPPVRGQPPQFRDEVLAQRAARAVVDERGLAPGQLARGVAHQAPYGAVGRRGQVVVEGDAAGHGGEQFPHRAPAGVRVEPADDDDGQGHGLLP